MPELPLHDELQLIERAKTDDWAFSILYETYFPKIYGYVLKRVGNREEAEDIVSQTFLKMVEKLKSFKSGQGSSFKSWIYTIATNSMLDYFRKLKKHKTEPVEQHLEIASKEFNPQERSIQTEEQKKVFHTISLLPKKYQNLLTLKYYSDLEHEEIAETLGVTINNLGVLLHRALKKFREVYNALNLP